MSSFNPKEERQEARDFVLHYLKDDGVLLTRLLSLNSSDLVVTEIINQLWTRYKTVNRLYSTVNPQRHHQNIPTSEITNNENNINTSTQETNLNYQNGNKNSHRQRASRIPPLSLLTNNNQQQYSKNEKSENKSSKDTDV
ncbi:unnamed protein product [Rotaria sp. Silwood2]|nr:unnamed protein product [Rotaria sp. Silwood2]CAF2685281.1 unnamed protein product [Rotaria sp. Silwood2]CAF2948837.1 unnamed protein product [Rotaria sp. Silwood2]CAF3028215.1 unnamed protein product [Rotaria sp. Silwood2]